MVLFLFFLLRGQLPADPDDVGDWYQRLHQRRLLAGRSPRLLDISAGYSSLSVCHPVCNNNNDNNNDDANNNNNNDNKTTTTVIVIIIIIITEFLMRRGPDITALVNWVSSTKLLTY